MSERSHEREVAGAPNHTRLEPTPPERPPYSSPELRWYEWGIIGWANSAVRPYASELEHLAARAAQYLGLVVAITVIAGAADVHAQDRGTQETLILIAAVADIASTEYALNHVGIKEGNPLLGNRAVRIVGKAAATGVILWATRSLESDGHPKAAKVLRLMTAGVWFGAAGWNVSLTVRY